MAAKKRAAKKIVPILSKPRPKSKNIPGKAPGTRGGAKFIPTEEQRELIRNLRACGFTEDEIATATGLKKTTMLRHYRTEIDLGKVNVDSVVANNIARMAMAGDKTMCIYYSKSRMGWSDRSSISFEDQNGQKVNPAGLFTVNITG